MRRRLPLLARRAVAGLLLALLPALAQAQALPSLSLLRVRYNTAKTSAKSAGELKTQIETIDKELAEATRLGATAKSGG